MSVPLDRLYNFLHDVCNHRDLIIYRFFPHGSRKITDLKPQVEPKDWEEAIDRIANKRFMIVHDQEPLNFELYTSPDLLDQIHQSSDAISIFRYMDEHLKEQYKKLIIQIMPELNIKIAVGGIMWKVPMLLIHSEQRSKNLAMYEDIDFIGVYWWCHAAIARDWFRYAEHDPLLSRRDPQKDFLIYNRAWSGTREYRLKFAELIIDHNLVQNCVMGFNSFDDVDYRDHQFQNSNLQIQRDDLENYFFHNTTPSTASADYNSVDYQTTNLEVVLETLFDDDRLQLTEKILRPIACGHPFMIASTQGTLEYLQNYGFKTFGDLIDETYDTIEDPVERLQAIVIELKRIANLPIVQKEILFSSMRDVADYNRRLFFSTEWHDKIIKEYQDNLNSAIQILDFKKTQPVIRF